MVRELHSAWNHFIRIPSLDKGSQSVTCRHCSHHSHHRSLKRALQHLASCEAVPAIARQELEEEELLPEPTVKDRSKNSLDNFVDSVSEREQQYFERLLAEWIFEAGLPLSLTEHSGFRKLMSTLRPSFKIPPRRRISEQLLDSLYDERWSNLQQILRQQPILSIISDGWTNVRNEPIVNYLVSTADEVFFYKSVHTGAERHTGYNLAAGLSEVIEEIGAERVVGITVDNAANMRSAADTLRLTYPRLVSVGCCSHRLHLLAGDIFAKSSVARLYERANTISKWFRAHTLALEHVKKHAAANQSFKMKAFGAANNTRWQGKINVLRPIIHNLIPMQQAILELANSSIYSGNAEFLAIRGELFDALFISNLKELVQLLTPLLQVTIALESTSSQSSAVYGLFRRLLKVCERQSLVSVEELTALTTRRVDEALHPLFPLAYLADPKAREQMALEVPDQHLFRLGEWLQREWSLTTDEAGEHTALMKCLRDRLEPFNDDLVWKMAKRLKALDWLDCWKTKAVDSSFLRLCRIAVSIPPTTGEAERNWSHFGFIHNTLRNRLDNTRVNKLVFIHSSGRTAAKKAPSNWQDQLMAQAVLEVLEAEEPSETVELMDVLESTQELMEEPFQELLAEQLELQ